MINFLDANLVIAVCFIIFLYLAYRPIKKSIIAALDARIKEIKTNLAETEQLKQEAKFLLEEIEKKMEGFEEKKKDIIENSKKSTERLVETKTKEMDIMLLNTKNSAIKSIENQKNKACETMKAEFAKSVLNIVRTYLIETKNNSVSDEEILNNFIKK